MTDRNGIDIRAFRYFVAVAEELHFGRAARRLHLSQPPLSRQILQLERALGFPLFVRDRQHVELTDAGRTFLCEARAAIAQFDHALHMAQLAASGELATLRLGFCHGLECALTPLIRSALASIRPDWKLSPSPYWSHQQVGEIQARRLDFGLVRLPLGGFETLSLDCISREPLVAALPATGTRMRTASLASLSKFKFAVLRQSASPFLADHIQRVCRQSGLDMRIQAEADSFPALLEQVREHSLCAVLPASVLCQPSPGIRRIRLNDRFADVPIGFLHRPGNRSPVHAEFVTLVKRLSESTRFSEAF
jgi:DNA-binding transcriptional LysR family regulator